MLQNFLALKKGGNEKWQFQKDVYLELEEIKEEPTGKLKCQL
jgi:hypothetical protein